MSSDLAILGLCEGVMKDAIDEIISQRRSELLKHVRETHENFKEKKCQQCEFEAVGMIR